MKHVATFALLVLLCAQRKHSSEAWEVVWAAAWPSVP